MQMRIVVPANKNDRHGIRPEPPSCQRLAKEASDSNRAADQVPVIASHRGADATLFIGFAKDHPQASPDDLDPERINLEWNDFMAV
jgi:hypothetical protein